ncbi:GDP-L-fucose synthase [Alkalispirochaeta americana]|uniref:GDP-L-fucose synthase n=1 Tax=Alkalispirochaeta americana TaxID=159291 RepID=A0A1N6XK76_9SPIO|nr:GDP-L-fucose synthase [Alkalispirochaeta americana]SIR02629.1 GDP-L-fucose synthase [Alkalispirochaeta americana]
MNKNSRIYLAGHTGLVGSAVYRALQGKGYTNIITRTLEELDLTRQAEAEAFFAAEQPEVVILAAAKVGGILANNTYKAEFIYQNAMIAANVIHAAYRFGVTKLLNLGSSCIYPKLAEQPLTEEALLSGYLEPTNEPYAIAKIMAIKLCRYYNEQYGTNFISAMPTNLYGPGDNFDLQTSHVLPALLRKIHEAKAAGSASVTVWGDGSPLREFLYVEDLAQGLLFLLENVDAPELKELCPDYFVNIGTGSDVSIRDLAQTIAKVIGWQGSLDWDTSKPNGTPRKLMDVSKLTRLGWRAKTSLREGIAETYQWYTANGTT